MATHPRMLQYHKRHFGVGYNTQWYRTSLGWPFPFLHFPSTCGWALEKSRAWPCVAVQSRAEPCEIKTSRATAVCLHCTSNYRSQKTKHITINAMY